jgi:hypothetical protein
MEKTTKEAHFRRWKESYSELESSTVLISDQEKEMMLKIVTEPESDRHRIMLETGCTKNQYYHIRKKYTFVTVAGYTNLVRTRNVSIDGDSHRILVTKSEVFDILHNHHVATNHLRDAKKSHLMLKQTYENIPRAAIQAFVSTCVLCAEKRKLQTSKPEGVKPIISGVVNERGQVDLIDFRSLPDGDFKWLLRYSDHFSGFSYSAALTSKSSMEVSRALLPHFLQFGAPVILQSDNGSEFMKETVNLINGLCPESKIVRGRPRHPRSQGHIERSNAVFKTRLSGWIAENKGQISWSQGHVFVTSQLNRTPHSGRGNLTPYEIVFGSRSTINLCTMNLPKQIINIVNTEGQLRKLIHCHENNLEIDLNELRRLEEEEDQDDVDDDCDVGGDDDGVGVGDDDGVGEEQMQDQKQQYVVSRFESPENSPKDSVSNAIYRDMNLSQQYSDCLLSDAAEVFEQRKVKRRKIDELVANGQQKQAEKMLRNVNSSTKRILHIKDVVFISLKNGTRGCLDGPRLSTVVLERDIQRNRYKLCTKNSVLENWYDRGSITFSPKLSWDMIVPEFESMNEKWQDIKNQKSGDEYKSIVVSELEANRRASAMGGYHIPRTTCKCTSKCDSNRCICWKVGVSCHSKCHGISNIKCTRK